MQRKNKMPLIWDKCYGKVKRKPTKWLAPSEDSDQPGHPESSLCAQWVTKDPSFLHVDSEDSDPTGQMPRLIWVFAGCTDNFVGFVKRRLISRFLLIWIKPIIGHRRFGDTFTWLFWNHYYDEFMIDIINCNLYHHNYMPHPLVRTLHTIRAFSSYVPHYLE